jgi:hypothetical protein
MFNFLKGVRLFQMVNRLTQNVESAKRVDSAKRKMQ